MSGKAFLFMIIYTASYLTRINYGAVVLEMARDTGWSNELLSMALTGSFITYGVGQLVRFMVSIFSPEEYPRAAMLVCLGSPIGTVLVYLAAPLWIGLWGWRSVFWICAFCGWAAALLWIVRGPRIELEQRQSAVSEKAKAGIFLPMLLMILLAILLQGTLRDGVATWMPSYISESYGLGSRISIFTGVLMLLFSIGCYQAANLLYRRFPGNPLLCAGGFFGAATLSAFFLALIGGRHVLGSVLFMALLTGCMHGTNLMLIGMIPAFYRKTGRVSFVSGLLNSFTYVGSSLSTYGVAWLSEWAGWGAAIRIWLICALFGFLICILCIPAWRRRFTT